MEWTFDIRSALLVGAMLATALAAVVPELSKGRLKDAMNKGAVIWRRGKQQKRLRRAQSPVAAGDLLQLNYDDDLLSRQCEPAVLLADERHFSLWYKPPGMLSQGNEWGDHLSLLRFAEQQLGNRAVFLIHRLDREASGLLLLAHSPWWCPIAGSGAVTSVRVPTSATAQFFGATTATELT